MIDGEFHSGGVRFPPLSAIASSASLRETADTTVPYDVHSTPFAKKKQKMNLVPVKPVKLQFIGDVGEGIKRPHKRTANPECGTFCRAADPASQQNNGLGER